MKLHQNLLLGNDLVIETMLSGTQQMADNYRFLVGPFDFSFHPYVITAYVEKSVELILESKYLGEFKLELIINDDEQHKPLFGLMSQNRSLLLIAEFTSCFNQALSTLGLSIISLTTKSSGIELVINTQSALSQQQLIGVVMIALNSVDSLLFLRGLALSQASIEFLKQIDFKLSSMLKTMVSNLYAQL